MDKFNYVVKKSSELTNNEISDFLEIINTVFNHDYDHEWFNWKYLSNIYGESIVVITYFKSILEK
jgi:hypothetical protein